MAGQSTGSGSESTATLAAPRSGEPPEASPPPSLRDRLVEANTSRWMVLPAAAFGVGVALGFPPYDWWPLLLVGILGFAAGVQGVTGRRGALLGFAFGLGFMLPLMRWITVIGPDAWIALGVLEATFYALLGYGWAKVQGLAGRPLWYAALWVGGEALRGAVPFGGLPWGRLAFGLTDTSLIVLGRYGGTALVSFVVVAAVVSVLSFVTRQTRARRIGLAATLVALVVGVAVLPAGPAGSVVRNVRVATIQGNVPGQGLDAFAERRAVLDNHAAATRTLAREVADGTLPRPDLVIWPENSTDIDPFSDPAAFTQINDAVRAIGVPVLVGAVVDGPDADHVQNMGVVWSPATGPGARYVKRHPVPFGEYIPFRSLLTRFITRLDQIPKDFAQGGRPGLLGLGPATIGDVICFEVAYDGLVRDVFTGGAQFLVVQTNNATYAGTGQLEQQFAISRYRAVESGKWVVVASTDGISGMISPDGQVYDKTRPRSRAITDREIALIDGVTLGTRIGGWLDLGLSLLGLAAVLGAMTGAWSRRTRG